MTALRPASISTMPAATSHRRLSPHPTATTLGERAGPHSETGQSSPPGQVRPPDLRGTATSEPERRVDLARRGRTVERVEVQPRRALGQQLLAHRRRVLDTDLPYGVRIVLDGVHPFGELYGEPRAGQLG